MVLTKDELKAENERKVFRLFAEAVGWANEGDQIESRSPPEPDILFGRSEGHVAFELLSATTPEFRQLLQNAQIIYPDNLPIDQKLRKKISTNYQSQFLIDLLIYWSLASETDDQILLATQDVLWNDGCGVFRHVWYFGEKGRKFRWHKNWWSELNVCA
jgi:hypothetical protein